MERIQKEIYERHSGCERSWEENVLRIKRCNYHIVKDFYPGGDQPKVFAKLYQHTPRARKFKKLRSLKSKKNPNVSGSNTRKFRRGTWPSYIAKFGKKFYPVESITEHLFTVLGKALGLEMAETQLCIIEGQLRLASKNFLSKNERLFHGADLLSQYLGDDDFINLINDTKMDGELFSCEDARNAIDKVFPSESYELLCKFDQMLVLDCILGVNDRHYYNWGIITDITGVQSARFAPLFDTSRGLLWNYTEQQLAKYVKGVDRKKFIEKYVNGSRAQLSVTNLNKPSHFELIEKLSSAVPGIRHEAEVILHNAEDRILGALYHGFERLLSENRIKLIEEILRTRISLTLRSLGL